MDEWLIRLQEALDGGTEDDYSQGVQDVLRLLGWMDAAGQACGDVTAMLLASLRAHAAQGLTAAHDWEDLDASGLRGVDVLRALEASRIAGVEAAAPARHVSVAQVIIKRGTDAGDQYLYCYDPQAGQYQPVGGKRDPEDASLEAALRREMFEELELGAIPTVQEVSLELVKDDWRTQEVSRTYGILTGYQFAFFHAQRLLFPLTISRDIRWIGREQIAAGWAADEREISPILQTALGWDLLDRLGTSL
ncbi:MAG: NUDIX domain-containing protein [Chloroflexi bacterium]|nr:NUDIX domain-containing protein [Chloroflexota bacterium]